MVLKIYIHIWKYCSILLSIVIYLLLEILFVIWLAGFIGVELLAYCLGAYCVVKQITDGKIRVFVGCVMLSCPDLVYFAVFIFFS